MRRRRTIGTATIAASITLLAAAVAYLGLAITRLETAWREADQVASARSSAASKTEPDPDEGLPNRDWDSLPRPNKIVPLDPEPYPEPPPHEGALVTVPYIVEPPDMIRIEVLYALPGRPITGERLVRGDGKISLDFYGDIEVAGLTLDQIKVKTILQLRKFLPDVTLGLVQRNPETNEVEWIDPLHSDRVFVEVLAFNSKYYHVNGQFRQIGKLPITGHDTVLDAIQTCGGLSEGADPDHIELIRPARGGQPTRTYAIDYRAIVVEGDSSANLQLFAGDRLVAYAKATAIEVKAEPESN
ncbi:MAG: polysaccharide biosynthesis/export family protein [Isosphaeraceae bacterium]